MPEKDTPGSSGPDPAAGLTAREILVRNERLKLGATYVNGIAITLFAVGALAPFIGATVSLQPSPVPLVVFGVSLICCVGSGILHWIARGILGDLEP